MERQNQGAGKEKSTSELTNEFINEHPDIKNCLKKGLINYSSLARYIAKDLGIENKTSKEAILIAARRFKQKLEKEHGHEAKIRDLLSQAETEIKNKINVFILEKNLDMESIDDMQKKARTEGGKFYLSEGSGNYTIITQERYAKDMHSKFKLKIIKHEKDLALINLKTPVQIEELRGVVAFITSLFAENGVNIVEFLSCWNDIMFIIDAKDVTRTIEFLKF